MPSPITKLSARLQALEAGAQNVIIGLMRMVVGVLWLANIEWKRPSDFGLAKGNGLYKYVNSAVENPVFPPYSWFVKNVVMKNYQVFGWITLITEIALAALLLIGFKTRLISLVGFGLSVSIGMSVLGYTKTYEWPWSYYLMGAIHLLLFAVGAGNHLGVDGIRRAGNTAWKRAHIVLGGGAVLVGLLGVLVARSNDFTASRGSLLGWKFGEIKVLWFNLLSALLTVLLGALIIGGAIAGQRILAIIGGAGFAVLALLVLVLWRDGENGWTGGFLGATGGTAAFWAALAIGVLATARSVLAKQGD
jgi:thiosulfate dehydrogenase (quinone) large subunit